MHDFLFFTVLHQPLWIWLMFFGIFSFILFLDLGVLERKAEEISAKKKPNPFFHLCRSSLFVRFVDTLVFRKSNGG